MGGQVYKGGTFLALTTCNKLCHPLKDKEFDFESLYVDCGCKNCCLFKLYLRMDPWRSFWERLWAASHCEFLRDSELTNGNHGGESMRQLSHTQVAEGVCR